MGYYIRFRQKKTKGVETLPISEQAKDLLGEEGKPEEKVFQGLHYSAWSNLKLQQWMLKAGITKNITLKGTINKIAEYPFGFAPPVVMGVSARGNFKRSDFGMVYAVEEKLVGDIVELIIEFEARRN